MKSNNNAAQRSDTRKLKNAGKGWNRSLKTWLALQSLCDPPPAVSHLGNRTVSATSVYRDCLRNSKVGEFPMHLNLVTLDRSLRGRTEWWTQGRGR